MEKSALKIETPDFDGVLGGLSLLMLPPARKRRFLARQARMVIAKAQKNVRDQKTVDGAPFEKRSKFIRWERRARARGKSTSKPPRSIAAPMLTKLTKSKWLGVRFLSDDEAEIFFPHKKVKDEKNGVERWVQQGNVAYKHQHGKRETVQSVRYVREFDSSKVPTRLNKQGFICPNGQPGCSANQAAMLIRLDYIPRHLRNKVPGGGTETIKFLMQNVGRGIAAFLIQEGKKKRGFTEIPVNTPARPFLGAGTKQRKAWAAALFRDIDGSFKAKNYQGLLK